MSAMWRQIKLGKVYTFVSFLQKASGEQKPDKLILCYRGIKTNRNGIASKFKST